MSIFHIAKAAPAIDQHWWAVITPGDWLGAVVNGVSILFAILIAVYFTPKLNDRKSRREAQEKLLRVLINTWLTPSNADYQSAIALIPLDFKGCVKVLTARDELLSLVNKDTPDDPEEAKRHFEEIRRKQSLLISTAAREIGFDVTADSLLSGAYVTQGFIDREVLLINAMVAWQRIATALERSNDLFAPEQRD